MPVATPFFVVPDDDLPTVRSHPLRKVHTDWTKAHALTVAAYAAEDDLDPFLSERKRETRAARADAIARRARGEKVEIPADHDESADDVARATAAAITVQAEANETTAVAEYDRVVVEHVAELSPGLSDRMHSDNEEARAALESIREPLSRALATRARAHRLRAAEAYAALVAAGAEEDKDYVRDPSTGFLREVGVLPVTVQADRLAATAFGIAPPTSETAAHINAVSAALAAIADEDPSAPWTAEALPRDAAEALGLSVPPLPSVKLETREEFNVRYRRAIASGETPPRLPENLGGFSY